MRHWHVGIVVLGAFLLGHAVAQDDEKKMEWTPPDWMKPTKEHEMLKKSAGDFVVRGEVFMGPGQTMQFDGTAQRTSIMNGLYIEEVFKGSFMGQPFEGRLIQGYDPFRKKHVHVWIDNGNPVLAISYGDEKDGKYTMVGENPDAHLNKIITMKSITEEKDGKMVMEAFRVIDGKDELHMRLTYTRKE